MNHISVSFLVLMVSSLLRAETPAVKESRYAKLLDAMDLYAVPTESEGRLRKYDVYSALQNNGLEIKMAKNSLDIAEEGYQLTYDGYLPTPTLSSSYTYTQSVGDSITTTKAASVGLSISGTSTWGMSYSLDIPQISQSIRRTNLVDRESNEFSLGASVTFNLLRGSLFFLGSIPLEVADLEIDSSRLSYRGTVLTRILEGENAFHDLLQKLIRVRVLERSVASTKALLSDVTEMFRAGDSGKLEMVKVQLQLAQTETDLWSSRNDLSVAREKLRDIMAISESDRRNLVPDPSDIKDIPLIPELSIEANLDKARKQRPDYLIAKIAHRQAQLSVKTALSNVLPKLDLVASYSFDGSDEQFSTAVNESTDFSAPNYSIGLQFSYSFFNDSAKTSYRTSKIRLLNSEYKIHQLENSMVANVTAAVRSVELSLMRLKTSEMARKLSEQKLTAEFEKYRVGESKIRNIVDFQTETDNARISELNAKISLYTAISQLRNTIGELPPGIKYNL